MTIYEKRNQLDDDLSNFPLGLIRNRLESTEIEHEPYLDLIYVTVQTRKKDGQTNNNN